MSHPQEIVHRVGIDCKHHIPEGLRFAAGIFVQKTEVFQKGLLLLRSVPVLMGGPAIAQVVGYPVVRPQTECGVYAPVYESGDLTVVYAAGQVVEAPEFCTGKGFADLEMDPSLIGGDSRNYAAEVLTGLLYI